MVFVQLDGNGVDSGVPAVVQGGHVVLAGRVRVVARPPRPGEVPELGLAVEDGKQDGDGHHGDHDEHGTHAGVVVPVQDVVHEILVVGVGAVEGHDVGHVEDQVGRAEDDRAPAVPQPPRPRTNKRIDQCNDGLEKSCSASKNISIFECRIPGVNALRDSGSRRRQSCRTCCSQTRTPRRLA